MLLRRYFKNLLFYKRTIVSSNYPDMNIRKETIAENYFRYCDKYSERIAFVDYHKDVSYTYWDFKNSIKSIASSVTKRGFQQGTIVGIIASNCPEYIMLQAALSSIGCTVMLCNNNYTKYEILAQIKDSKSTVLFSTEDAIDKVSQAASEASFVKDIYLIGRQRDGFKSVEELLNDSGNMNPIGHVKLDVDNQVALIPYSSGTTGLPKGTMLTHTNVVSNFHQLNRNHTIGENMTLLLSLPLYHIYANNGIPAMSIFSGSKIVTQSRFDPKDFLDAIEKYKVSVLHLVPPQILFFLNHPLVSKYDLSSILTCFCAAAPLDINTEKRFLEQFRANQPKFAIYQGYGLTETSPSVFLMPKGNTNSNKHGSVGLLLPNMKCKVVDVITREEVFANKLGEILLKGPNIMKGYFNKPLETEKTFENGWFVTGDIGHYDSDNYFYISDRIKELIKVKGLQVAPAELEATLLTIPGIVDCAVIGVPEERCGEVPKAFVVRKTDINEKEINDYMASHLSPHKQLKGGIKFVNEIPKSPSGKILRKLLKDK